MMCILLSLGKRLLVRMRLGREECGQVQGTVLEGGRVGRKGGERGYKASLPSLVHFHLTH
jgi:hypothetical protein